MNEVRAITKNDIDGLKAVLNSIELFPSDMLEDMIYDYFNNPNSEEIWFTKTANKVPISIGFCAPEKLTSGTFNLYAIGIQKKLQGQGIGTEMMQYIENHLTKNGHRVLIVETSGADEFENTRRFYDKLQYTREAIIRDFWNEGDDKVIFWKKLT